MLSHSSYLQPSSHHSSICPRSPLTAKSGYDRGGCIVGRLLGGWQICLPAGVVFHWRRESIMPPWRRKHRSFPVGRSDCSPNPKHSFAFLSSADNLKCLFGTSSQASDCMSLCLKSYIGVQLVIHLDSLKNVILWWLKLQIKVRKEK